MRVVRETYIIFKKDMLIWFKSPVVPVIRALVFPLLWIVIFGTAFGGTVEHIPVALVQEDFGAHAQGLVQELNKKEVLEIRKTTNYATAFRMLTRKEVYGVIFIPPGFSQAIGDGGQGRVQLSTDETSPQISSALIAHVYDAAGVYSDRVVLERRPAGGGPAEVVDPVVMEKNTVFGRGIEYLDFLAPGVVMMTIMFSAMFSGGLGVIVDREFGTLRMLMAAPITKDAIILGKIIAGVMQSIASGIVALIIAMLMGVELESGALGVLLIVLLMFIAGFGFIGMSTAIGARSKTLEQFMVMMQVIVMPMWFLSGGLYPLESMPGWMRVVATVNPLTYATDAVRAVMLRGIVWDILALDFLILISFSVVMFAMGSLAFKRTID
ncbi:MAG: ABC transporter permease [Euryarchaeota archaeon]|nr:ABC transporter permease [Euryarchaeota archaeon]